MKYRAAQCDFSPVWMIGNLRASATGMPPAGVFSDHFIGRSADRSEQITGCPVLFLKQAPHEAPICETGLQRFDRSAGP
jgi:hypothetical protein